MRLVYEPPLEEESDWPQGSWRVVTDDQGWVARGASPIAAMAALIDILQGVITAVDIVTCETCHYPASSSVDLANHYMLSLKSGTCWQRPRRSWWRSRGLL